MCATREDAAQRGPMSLHQHANEKHPQIRHDGLNQESVVRRDVRRVREKGWPTVEPVQSEDGREQTKMTEISAPLAQLECGIDQGQQEIEFKLNGNRP